MMTASSRGSFARTLGVLAGSVALTLAADPSHAKTEWDYALYLGPTHPVTGYLQGFADEVARRTDGELVITLRPAGELPIKATEMVKAVGTNLVQMGQAASSLISGEVPIAGIPNMPFLIRDYDELEQTWPIIEEYVNREFENYGVVSLFHWSWPPSNLYGTGDPVRTIDDFVGRKFRSLDAKQAEMLQRLGASAVTLTTAEVPVAMERGVVEGVITAAFNARGAKWTEFLEWGYLPEISVTPGYQIVNLEAFDALSAEHRQILREVGAETSRKMLSELGAREAQDRRALADEHGLVMAKPSEEDLQAIIALMESYWVEWAKRQGPPAPEMIGRLREALDR